MYILILSTLLCYILIFPEDAVRAAALGLNLWYEKILPTLLPVSILSYLLIHSGILDGLAKILHRFFKYIFPVSSAGLYPLIAGLLFGFPMGSKITADLVNSGKMTRDEGRRLFCACNNISPMFVSGFILNDCLNRPDLRLPTYLILYTPPLVLYMIQNHRRHFMSPLDNTQNNTSHAHVYKKSASMNFQIIDAGIMNGFETMVKLGGYIMLFAILAQMVMVLPLTNPTLKCCLIGFTEITNGIAYTSNQNMNLEVTYPLMMAYTAFGGLSGFAQTASMVKDADLPMMPYLLLKLMATALSSALAYFFIMSFT